MKTYLFTPLIIWISALSLPVKAQQDIISKQSGNWTNKNTWTCNCIPTENDNVTIETGHIINFVATNKVNNLTINSGGVLSDNGLTNIISGFLVINGTYSGSGVISLTGSGTSIDGKGTISNTATLNITGSKTIAATAELTKGSGDVNILGEYTITNHGTVTIGGNIKGTVAQSTWINAEGATLNIGGTPVSPSNNPLLFTGTLDASAINNTVNYYSPDPITIKLPAKVNELHAYYNLIISGSNTKTLPNGEIVVNGDLTINSTLNGNGALKTLLIRGNWINNGGFIPGNGKVIFDGTGNQSVVNSAGEPEDFNHLVVNKPVGKKLTLNTNVVVASNIGSLANNSTLTMLSGDIEVGSNLLTLGRSAKDTAIFTGNLMWTSGTIIGQFERWISASAGEILFPVGIVGYHRPIKIFFNNVTNGSLVGKFNSAYPGNSGLPLTEDGVTLNNTFRDGFWSLIPKNFLSSNDFNIELAGEGFAGFVIDNETRILTRPNANSLWTLDGTHGSNEGSIVKRNNVTLLNAEFCFGDKTACAAPTTEIVVEGKSFVCKEKAGEMYSLKNADGSTYAPEGSTYEWFVDGGVFPPDLIRISDSALPFVTVNWGARGMTGSVSVIERNNCTQGPVISMAVDIHSIPPASINGKINVPENDIADVIYSVTPFPGYSYSWETTNGSITGGQGTASITVKWGPAGKGEVYATGKYLDCPASSSRLDVKIYKVISSVKTGTWSVTDNANNRSLWDCSCIPAATDNVTIKNTHQITISTSNNPSTNVNHLTIEGGGILIHNSAKPLSIKGDLNVNGSIMGSGTIDLDASLGTAVIDGIGNINNSGNLNCKAPRTIFSKAAITKNSGALSIANNITIINNGTFLLGGSLIGGNSNSKWINAENSILAVGGDLLTTGKLEAASINNTIRYNGSLTQTIKIPESGQYNNISLAGTGTKALPTGTILVKGDFSNDAIISVGSGTVVFNGISSITGLTAPNFHHLTISGSLVSSDMIINVSGNFKNDGAFNHNHGTVMFNGTSGIQNISGSASLTTFQNINTANNVSVEAAMVDLLGNLNIGSGRYFDADGLSNNSHFSLRSTNDSPATDASIGPLLGGAEVRGAVNIERYLNPNGKRLYRYISSPVANATIADWQDDFAITGNFSDRSQLPASLCNVSVNQLNPSLFYYNEKVQGLTDYGYETLPAPEKTAAESLLQRGLGYVTFIRECSAPTLIDVKNEVHQGTFDLPVSYTPSNIENSDYHDGWNLIGNPYPSAIRWNLLAGGGWSANNMSNVIAIMDNNLGGFRYWDGTTSLSQDDYDLINNGIIAIGQAFWVKAMGEGAKLTISESVKYSGEEHSFYRAKNSSDISTLSITMKKSNTDLVDRTFVKLRKGAAYELDSWDATKLSNALHYQIVDSENSNKLFDLATLTSQGKKMAINAVPHISEGVVIPISIANADEGSYEMDFHSSGEFSRFQLILTDNLEGTTKTLSWGDIHGFKIRDSRLNNATRFSIQLVSANHEAANQQNSFSVYPNPVRDNLVVQFSSANAVKFVTIFDLRGEKLQEHIIKSADKAVEIDFSSLPNGLYLMRIIENGYNRTIKIIKD